MAALPERRLLFLLAAVQFVNILDFVIMMPLGPLFMADLDISPAQLGLLVSSYTIAASISSLLAGRWINRQPRKLALLASLAVFAVATLLCGISYTYLPLLAARVVAGAAGGPATSIVLTIVTEAVHASRRGRGLAFVQSAFSVASVIGVPLGLYLANLGSWRSPFLLLGLLAALLWVLLWRRLPRFSGHLAAVDRGGSLFSTLRTVLADGNARMAYLTHALVMGSGFALIPFLSPYLVSNRGVATHDLGVFYLVGGALTFVMIQFIGRLTDRFGTLRIYSTVAVLFAVNMQLILWLPLEGLELVPVFALFMVLTSSRMVPLVSLYSRIPPAAVRGAFMSYLSTVQHMAAGVGTLVAGLFLTLDGDGRLQRFDPAAEITVVIGLAVILLARKLAARAGPRDSSDDGPGPMVA